MGNNGDVGTTFVLIASICFLSGPELLDNFYAGFKCHCHLCNDFLLFNVCRRILSSKTFSSTLW